MLVGLTGGIAAGKSTVAGMFRGLGARVLDADQLSREVMAGDADLRRQLVQAFGGDILDAQGQILRQRLGAIAFADPVARKKLEAITHPAISQAARQRVEALLQQGKEPVIYEAALLVESGRYQEMDRLVVVVADDELRIERLAQRNGFSREEAWQRMQAQLPQDHKAALAHYIIDNSGSLEDTRHQVEESWQRLHRELE